MLRSSLSVLALVLGPACRAEPHPGVAQPPIGAGQAHPAQALHEPEQALTRVTIGAIRWYVDYEAALTVARAQDKALWVHFGENPG